MSEDNESRRGRITQSLRRVILLRETGPKSAAWHRARAQTIWRLHHLLERQPEGAKKDDERRDEAP